MLGNIRLSSPGPFLEVDNPLFFFFRFPLFGFSLPIFNGLLQYLHPALIPLYSFLDIYKRNQGYYTRVGTAVGAGILILAGANFAWNELSFETNARWTSWVQIGVVLGILVVCGTLLWWVVGVNRTTADFMIATEGEMKKVNWSTKREVIGSTKVVIVFTILLAILLAVVDLAFRYLFRTIGVLKI